jgi:hypothetical protein
MNRKIFALLINFLVLGSLLLTGCGTSPPQEAEPAAIEDYSEGPLYSTDTLYYESAGGDLTIDE